MSLENGDNENGKSSKRSSKYIDELDRLDLITELLMHNMVEVAERIYIYPNIGFRLGAS